jgi:hypothetical protein
MKLTVKIYNPVRITTISGVLLKKLIKSKVYDAPGALNIWGLGKLISNEPPLRRICNPAA